VRVPGDVCDLAAADKTQASCYFSWYQAPEILGLCMNPLPVCLEATMRQFSVGHCCDFCGQEIGYVLPDSPAEAIGAVFQERTFLELSSAQIRDPSRRVAEYWYCSDYCAREALDIRINQREKQMRQHREGDRLSLCFFFAV
jgi:hypothetical protein